MSKTEPSNARDLDFDVEIISGGRAHDSGTLEAPARTISPTRLAAKAEARRRKATLAVLCAFGLAALALWSWLSNPNANVPSDAVARVNGDYIYERDITREVDLARVTIELNKGNAENVPSRAKVLEDLINRKMQVQDARKAGVVATAQDSDNDVQQILKRTGQSQAQLEAMLARYNLKLDDMRQFSADFLMVNKYIADHVVKGAETPQDRQNRVNDWLTNLAQNGKVDRFKSPETGPAPSVGSQAPDFTLKDLNGKEVKLSSLKGRPVMVNFWATWCPPCRAEIPMIVQTYAEPRSQADSYEILGVATQSDRQTVQAFAKEFGIKFPVLPDTDNRITDLYHVLPIPTSFFIDKDGIIRDIHIGMVDREMMQQWLLR